MNNSDRTKEISQILRFWHQVEFFIPFDLQKQVLEADDAEWAVHCRSVKSLRREDRPLWSPPLPPGRRLTGFDVYFGVFDKSVLAEVTRHVLHESLHPNEALEQEERGDLEGLTCIAKIKTGCLGEPLLDEVSVSTAPWALGRIQRNKGQLAALDFDAFQDGIKGLKEHLRHFRAERDPAGEANAACSAFSGRELLALLAIFEEWTGFHPEPTHGDAPVIVIRAKSVEDRLRKRSTDATSDDSKSEGIEDNPEEDDDDDSAGEDEIEIDILNSFFAKDIERAIASVERGEHIPALNAYLAPLPPDMRLDLYSPQGREAILRTLSPAKLPNARWPDKPAHAMSLMQQFAINSLLERLETEGIFSVNGPPGTGKTTLLRDVFAELTTRRARVMAGLAKAGDAFTETVQVDFRGIDRPCYVRRLREDLTGFEMVVASSNNAAVENLSRDLPKSKSLGKAGETPWRDDRGVPTIGYLQTVAHNIAARKAKGDYAKLSIDDTPWGLIACTLGKKGNRSNFAYRLTADGGSKDQHPPKGFDPEVHQSLWQWREKYRGPSFIAAREAFVAADEAVTQRKAQIDRYAFLCPLQHSQTLESFCASCNERVTRSWQVIEAAQAELKSLDQERDLCKGQLLSLGEEAQLIERGRPAWWLRLFLRERDNQFKTALEGNRLQRRIWLSRQREVDVRHHDAERQLQLITSEHAKARAALAARELEWQALQREWKDLTVRFPQMSYPQSADTLENQRWQIDGLWHDETFNKLRSELFVAALGLHEAWLAEVLRTGGGFAQNLIAIKHLLSGKLQQREHALAIWQSLFMIVPVVSSTFASIASQFRDLGPNSLGWLFIDEAGQAVPQAAVGALWRTKRAVVVGDPLQIEPVFTVPIRLIEALEREANLPDRRQVAPHRVSVQTLADLGNALGTEIGTTGPSQWIGSPLRVHRRCVDPMFTIANEIAYQGKMIFFDPDNPESRLPPPGSLNLGPSSWVNIGGKTQDKHVVKEQIDLVCDAVQELYRRRRQLPALYIISPFKHVKNAVVRRLSNPGAWSTDNKPTARALREWCKERVGTVHTFQGKEENLVWMVLGCDASTVGAAQWAASKPNLFNVALTRAKHRFFVIGDAELWAGLPHFLNATPSILPRIHPETFLQRIKGQGQ